MKRPIFFMAVFAIAIGFLSAQAGTPTQSPGLDVVGFGYDVFGKYADMASKKAARIFELGATRVEPIGSDRFEVPQDIYLEPVVDHRVSIVEGSSVREYAKNLSVNAGLKVDGLLFKASVESNISTGESENVQRFYYTYMDSNVMWRISMDTIDMNAVRKRMPAKVRDEIDTLEPSSVFAKYGTHYIASAYLGGRADYTTTSVISDKVSTASLKVAIEAEYKAISGKSEINADQRKALQDSETKSELRVVGGNARYVNNIRDYDQYVKWADGIEGRPVLCDFDKDSLRPIWELASSPGRRQQLESAFADLLKTNPLPPELVNLAAVSRQLYMVKSKTEGTFWDLAGYHNDAQQKGGKLALAPSDRVNTAYEGADRFIKVIPNPAESGWVFLQPQHSNYALDISGGSKDAGAAVWLWDMANSNSSGQFKLIAVADEKDTFYIQSRVSGLYLEPVPGGGGIVQMPFAGGDNQKWLFIPTDPKTLMAPPANGSYSLQCVAGGKFWDFSGSYPASYTNQVQLWDGPPNERSADRLIDIQAVDGNFYKLRPRHLINHIASAQSKERMAAYTYDGSNIQLWSFEYAGVPNSYFIRNRQNKNEVVSANSGRVNVNGCEVSSYPFFNDDSQKWVLTRFPAPAQTLSEGVYYLKVKGTNKYLDLAGNEQETNRDGAMAAIWENDNKADRKVRFIPHPSGDGSYVIQFQNGDRVLDVSGAKNAAGTKLQAWSANNGDAQRWLIEKYGDSSTFVFVSFIGGRILDVTGGKINENGTNLQIWDRNNSASQQFQIEYADGPNKGKLFVGE